MAEVSLHAERGECEAAAKRKFKYASIERAYNKANHRLWDIRGEIVAAPAEGPIGIAIKLALWRHMGWDETDENNRELLVSAYETAVKLAGGVDYAAQVERW